MKLDKEEKELLKSYEKDEWKSIKDLEKKKLEYQTLVASIIHKYVSGKFKEA
jgi:predicted DNA binding CopG/RHH family protein